MTDFRALCAELAEKLDELNCHYNVPSQSAMIERARTALGEADEPAVPEDMEPVAVTGQPSDGDLLQLMPEQFRADLGTVSRMAAHGAGPDIKPGLFRVSLNTGALEYARAVLARWGNPAPVPPADGEVAELEAWLRSTGEGQPCLSDEGYARLTRAAELLQQQQVMVPVSVSDALIKAECALSDIAEGEPMTDEGDPLQWAERRCADTLAIIRPTMRQHKIRTSEWPPLPLPEAE